MSWSPHVVVIPYPAQGHVIPLMELSHSLLDHGFHITFVNTQFNHDRLVASLSSTHKNIHPNIRLVAIPDGLDPHEDRTDLGRLCEGAVTVMPAFLDEVIKKFNDYEDSRISWMIADKNMAWALEVAKKRGLRVAAFWPASTAQLALMMSVPKLIRDGVLDERGLPIKREMVEVIPGAPPIDTSQFSWNLLGESKMRETVFRFITNNNEAVKLAEFVICNSFYELESAVFSYMPNLIPIGPLITDQHFNKPVGTFWPEDAACVSWLDKQPPNSTIYVAFGSLTVLNHLQFQELLLGLELTGRPFLLVVRPDLTNTQNNVYPVGFLDRVGTKGMIVDWSPQQKVLSHQSIACFFSHCGWNSTIEGVRNGVPFLCRPYFTDQFLNQSYICDVWRVGLRMDPDESGMILKEQVKAKVDELLGDEELKARCNKWKEMANESIKEGGLSYMNFNSIVDAMKTINP